MEARAENDVFSLGGPAGWACQAPKSIRNRSILDLERFTKASGQSFSVSVFLFGLVLHSITNSSSLPVVSF